MSAQILINALTGVKARGQGKWICKCPAHQDRTASLSVSETQDGRTLLKCFAGCDTEAILGAVGMEFADLFPERLPDAKPQKQRHYNASDLLDIVRVEITLAAIIASDMQWGIVPTEQDVASLNKCANALNRAANELRG